MLWKTITLFNSISQLTHISNSIILIMEEIVILWKIIAKEPNNGRMTAKRKYSCRRQSVRKMNCVGNIKAWKIRWVSANTFLQKSFSKNPHRKWIHKFHHERSCSICNWCHCSTHSTKVEWVNCPKVTVQTISLTTKQNVCWREFLTESQKTMNEWVSKSLLRSVSTLTDSRRQTTFGKC
jgi:excinuclease UvrABC ATPase subunit